MIHNYNDYLLTEKLLLNDDFLLTEKLSFNKIKSIIKSVTNKEDFVNNLITRFNNAKSKITKKNIAYLLVILFAMNFMSKNSKWSNKSEIENIENIDNIEELTTDLALNDTLTKSDVVNFLSYSNQSNLLDKESGIAIDSVYVNPQTLNLSDNIKEFIKKEEGCRLTAYDIGDGKITIGYGHAEMKNKSKFSIGDTITQVQAETMFEKDIKYFEKGIKRMFRQWSEKGHNIKISQGMFDSLISMAYNMGITRLRNTEFIDHIMNGNFDTAGDLIPNTSINDKKFPGLRDRRKEEQKFFNSAT